MKLVVAPEAAAQILVRKQWWRANRSKAPERFDEELAAALIAISERGPSPSPFFRLAGAERSGDVFWSRPGATSTSRFSRSR